MLMPPTKISSDALPASDPDCSRDSVVISASQVRRRLWLVQVPRWIRLLSVTGDVLFATEVTAPFDIAIVWLQKPLPDIIVPNLASSFKPGKSVCVIGYGAFGHSCGHSVTSGILSKVVTCQSEAVMLQTTCAVQAGASGGALVQADTGELLGLVCSNTRDFAADVTYPHLNFSIPMSVLAPLLQAFCVTHDPKVFQKLDDAGPEVARVWRLQIRPQRHQNSKL
ncbi:peroxisomal leader peptide-processing protease [Brienomyrus brachyistius]|uniref:peroxisomal leader peptide-processing protease n=1 Tax=Brienomyrus brachyistius TaxID=42636 RepID=UPI0020B2CFA6|nr:peroxisomal leader peptide-processing protease [Brienomyrus brachyistius]